MWVYLNNSFVSIVEDKANRHLLLVRGRFEGDVERFLSVGHDPDDIDHDEVQVDKTPNADYLYRATVPREMVMRAINANVAFINYDNFKGSIPLEDQERHASYLQCWNAMADAQAPIWKRWMGFGNDTYDEEMQGYVNQDPDIAISGPVDTRSYQDMLNDLYPLEGEDE